MRIAGTAVIVPTFKKWNYVLDNLLPLLRPHNCLVQLDAELLNLWVVVRVEAMGGKGLGRVVVRLVGLILVREPGRRAEGEEKERGQRQIWREKLSCCHGEK